MLAPAMREGVIRFTADHRHLPLGADAVAVAARLAAWRRVLRGLCVVGQDPGRYGGYGYGNLSARLAPFPTPPGRRRFLVTGTQTSGKPAVTAADFALVATYDTSANRVESRGETLPSSEAMTHGGLYDLSSEVRAVFHAHSPELWHRADELGLPVTSPGAAEGTAALADEIRRLRPGWVLAACGLVVLGGHQDGVVAFGKSEEEAGGRLVAALTRAWT
jgi:hypothetical protein